MTGRLVGYARISTSISQSTDLQRRALIDAGVSASLIFEDHISGASRGASRPGLVEAMSVCRDGDVLTVWRIDRLGRSLIDILGTVENLSARGVGVRSLSDNIDPSTPTGRMLLGIFGTLAEYERLLIRERVQAGIEASRARGVRFGRPAPDPEEVAAKIRMARRAMEEDNLRAEEAARLVGWSRSTLYRHLRNALPA
jgi:DNA invertase Pin-like site-specific DNA recombinase